MLDFVYICTSLALARQPHLQTPILCAYFINNLYRVFNTEPSSEEAPAAVPSKEEPAAGSGGTPEDLIAWFNTTVKDYDAFFLIYYRGLW